MWLSGLVGAHLGLLSMMCSPHLLQRLVITPKGDLSKLFLSLFENRWGEMKLTLRRLLGPLGDSNESELERIL